MHAHTHVRARTRAHVCAQTRTHAPGAAIAVHVYFSKRIENVVVVALDVLLEHSNEVRHQDLALGSLGVLIGCFAPPCEQRRLQAALLALTRLERRVQHIVVLGAEEPLGVCCRRARHRAGGPRGRAARALAEARLSRPRPPPRRGAVLPRSRAPLHFEFLCVCPRTEDCAWGEILLKERSERPWESGKGKWDGGRQRPQWGRGGGHGR